MKCPYCNEGAADVLLNKVFCANKNCQWYDKVHAERQKSRASGIINKFIRDMRELENRKTNPDTTPTWHPNQDLGTD